MAVCSWRPQASRPPAAEFEFETAGPALTVLAAEGVG